MSIKRSLFNFCTNNILLNNLLIHLKLETKFAPLRHRYKNFKTDHTKTLQEIAGFSLRPEINDYLSKSHADLQKTANQFFPEGARILEIGCGPGLYLKDFNTEKHKLFAIDITKDMLELAQKENPSCTFYYGHFMETPISQKFNFIYNVGVLMYFSRTQINAVFKKMADILHPKGLIYINYPHAIRYADIFYPDLTYIQYSPALIEKIAAKYFTVLNHHHAYDGRKVGAYDQTPYKSENPERKTTYKNSYLLIAQKK